MTLDGPEEPSRRRSESVPKSSYYWSPQEEKKLVKLWKQGEHDATVLATQISRKAEAVSKKLQRLGLVVVPKKIGETTTNELKLPPELPTVEEALKMLASPMNALGQLGLTKTDILRLRGVVQAVKAYKELFADYVDYRGIEADLIEMAAKYEGLARTIQTKSRRLINVWPRAARIATAHRLVAAKEGRR